MKISLRDVIVLLDCAKFALRFHGDGHTGWERQSIIETIERIVNEGNGVYFELYEKEIKTNIIPDTKDDLINVIEEKE